MKNRIRKKKEIKIDNSYKLRIYNYIISLNDENTYEYSRTPSSKLGNAQRSEDGSEEAKEKK